MSPVHGFTPWPEASADLYRRRGYWTGQTLGGMLRERGRSHADHTALVDGDRRWTYAELDRRADRLAEGFRRSGVRPGERVVVQLPNIAEFFEVLFALFRLGGIPVLALPPHRSNEIGHFCRLSGATAYVVPESLGAFDYRRLAEKVCKEAPELRRIFVVGDPGPFTSLDSLPVDGPPLPDRSAGDVALLQLSGGSTALPKLIPRTHDDYLYSVRASVEICGLDETSVYLCALPSAHNFPLSSPGALGTFFAGGCVVLSPDPSPDTAFPLIERERVTITGVVPHLALAWLQVAGRQRHDLSSLRVLQVGGAKFSEEAARRVRPTMGCTLQQVFGMAEGLVNYTRLNDPEEVIVTTQGRPISVDDEILVVDDEDMPVPAGHPGHLLTRGPYTIRGYFQAREHNQRAFTDDGFYRTGDIVRRLANGYLIVEGRDKDQINRGGEKIAAEEIENILLAHPAVHDAALVAMADPYLGERSCAFVILRDGTATTAALRTHLRQFGVADYKIPDRFELVDDFPQTNIGKVDKKELRAIIALTLRPRPGPMYP